MSTQENAGNAGSMMKYSTGGVFNVADELAKAIKALGDKHNMIVPGGAIGSNLPLLYSVGISFVFVDPAKETYAIPGKKEFGLGKSPLNAISAASGVRWIPSLCGRTDNGSNPYYTEYQAVGTVLMLDGAERTIQGTKRIDLRAERDQPESSWGPDAQEIAREARRAAEKGGYPYDPWPRIMQQRQHILSLAETKAMNRAIRSLGVKTAYSLEDLKKGFAILRLQFTGRSENPETQREIELMIAARALGATQQLYGGAHAGLPSGPAPALALKPVPRIIDTTAAEPPDDDDEDAEPDADMQAPAQAAQPKAAAAAAETKATPEPAKPAPAPAPAKENVAGPREPVPPESDPLLICGDKDPATGKFPRKPCSAFDVKTLQAKIWAAEKNRPNWKPQWASKNEAELKAMKQWQAFKEFDPRQGTLAGAGFDPNDEDPF